MGSPARRARSASWSVDTWTSPRHSSSSHTFSNVGSIAGVAVVRAGVDTRSRLSARDLASVSSVRRPPDEESGTQCDHPADEAADEEVLGASTGLAVAGDLREADDALRRQHRG